MKVRQSLVRPHHFKSIGCRPSASAVPAIGEKSAYSATTFFASRIASGKILVILGPGEKNMAVAPFSISWRTELLVVNKFKDAFGPSKITEGCAAFSLTIPLR